MFALTSKSFALQRCFTLKSILRDSRALYYNPGRTGSWPEPITQPTLQQFLNEINYFQEPKTFINIGLKTDRKQANDQQNTPGTSQPRANPGTNRLGDLSAVTFDENKVDELLSDLGVDYDLPSLDIDDTYASPDQIANLALTHGIYRDLFDKHIPTSEYINFTKEQARRLDRLISPYWITDLPYSRVDRHPKELNPLYYFEPLVGLHAQFINDPSKSDKTCDTTSQTSFYGNIIPASEAQNKPTITLNGCWMSDDPYSAKLVKAKQFKCDQPGKVYCENFGPQLNPYHYSIILLNLDSLHPDSANLHWFITNIKPAKDNKELSYDEICEYLPVHGIRGFGHSRYVFLTLKHNTRLDAEGLKINDFSLEARKFDLKALIDQHKDKEITPLGLSWFQTTWDESSNAIFHDYLKMKAPVYDLVVPKYEESELNKKPYPGMVPFNVFLDHCRSQKDINKQVLLERLKNVDPFDYSNEFKKPKLPESVFYDDVIKPSASTDQEKVPEFIRVKGSWMKSVNTKKLNKLGYWRGLRPASALRPLNNNQDLDEPMYPVAPTTKARPGAPNKYDKYIEAFRRDLPLMQDDDGPKSVFVQYGHENHIKAAKEIMRSAKKKKLSEKNEEKRE